MPQNQNVKQNSLSTRDFEEGLQTQMDGAEG